MGTSCTRIDDANAHVGGACGVVPGLGGVDAQQVPQAAGAGAGGEAGVVGRAEVLLEVVGLSNLHGCGVRGVGGQRTGGRVGSGREERERARAAACQQSTACARASCWYAGRGPRRTAAPAGPGVPPPQPAPPPLTHGAPGLARSSARWALMGRPSSTCSIMTESAGSCGMVPSAPRRGPSPSRRPRPTRRRKRRPRGGRLPSSRAACRPSGVSRNLTRIVCGAKGGGEGGAGAGAPPVGLSAASQHAAAGRAWGAAASREWVASGGRARRGAAAAAAGLAGQLPPSGWGPPSAGRDTLPRSPSSSSQGVRGRLGGRPPSARAMSSCRACRASPRHGRPVQVCQRR